MKRVAPTDQNDATANIAQSFRRFETVLAQLLSKLNRLAEPVTEFQHHAELVRLSVELARLRGKTSPAEFMEEAADLLWRARQALAAQRERPRQEAERFEKASLEALDENFVPLGVSFDKLCRRPKSMLGSSPEPEFEKFELRLEIECDLKSDDLKLFKELQRKGSVEVSSPESDLSLVVFEWRVYHDEAEFKRLVEKQWADEAERHWQKAKAGRLNTQHVWDLFLTRQHRYKNRGAVVAASRLAPVNDVQTGAKTSLAKGKDRGDGSRQ
jgi:hypothetical protein